jgi:cyclin C
MSSDFWTSSHCNNWTLPASHLQQSRSPNLVKLNIYYTTLIHKLARSISQQIKIDTRQIVIATAIVYYRRFFTRFSLNSIDPALVCATSYYVASKVEECPIHIKTIVNQMKELYKSKFPFDATHISECEFFLFEALDYYTVVYHPYLILQQFISHLQAEKPILQTARYYAWLT